MSSSLHPDHMSPAERLAELTAILAAGVIRLRARKSSEKLAESGDFSLDFAAYQSGPQGAEKSPERGK